MSIYVDRKYIGLIQYRLEHFIQKSPDLYNFRCPFCLDSKKSKSKARGYIYKLTDIEAYAYKCWNCGKSISFANLIKELDTNAYQQYVLEKYCQGGSKHLPVEKPTFQNLKGNAAEYFRNHPNSLSISKVCNLPKDHVAVRYIEDRRIPVKFWSEIFYAEKFKDFMDSDFPDHGKSEKEIPNDERLVLLYTDQSGYVTHVAGRALDKENTLRYITVKVSDDERKRFGTHRLDDREPAYVVEGQFDSMFLDNCIASGDSNLAGCLDGLPDHDWTLVFDNEPRNKQIVKGIEKAIDLGYKVVIYPDGIEQKDINDMVLADIDVMKLVRENTYKGALAMLRFQRWKRV